MKQTQSITLDKDKILDQIKDLVAIAEKNNWQYEYDGDTDEFIFGESYMPRDSFLFNVNEELNLFLTPDSKVSGIFIEYFKVNYLEHNKELTPVLNILEEEEEHIKPIEDEKVIQQAKIALEQELIADTFKSIFSRASLVTAI